MWPNKLINLKLETMISTWPTKTMKATFDIENHLLGNIWIIDRQTNWDEENWVRVFTLFSKT